MLQVDIVLMLKAYYRLTKPGIIYGNSLSALAGFLFASNGDINVWLLLAALAGTALVIASGCVINNYIDRDIDVHMKRTKKRALVTGVIGGRNALIYATVLGLAGFGILIAYTNRITVVLGLIGFIDYVIFYTYLKRKSVYATLVGSISGAVPIAAGYTAVSGTFDSAALLLFLIMVCWQMPHFYAIAMFRQKEYAAASIPVLPIVQGIYRTKLHILIYIGAFMAASAGLAIAGHAGYSYLIVMTILGGWWLFRAVQGFKKATDDTAWARKLFFTSLIVLLGMSAILSIDAWLP